MFRRRNRRSFSQNLRETVWPSMGWERTWYYVRHRVMRHETTPGEIASGIAIGLSVSFTPLLGTHVWQAILFSWLFRANILAGVLGTLLGNPWTFPFMWWLSYKAGALTFAWLGFAAAIDMPDTLTLDYLLANPLKLLMPMTVGGIICAVLSWPVTYAITYYPVKGLHRAYRFQKLHRQRRLLQRRRIAQRGNGE